MVTEVSPVRIVILLDTLVKTHGIRYFRLVTFIVHKLNPKRVNPVTAQGPDKHAG